MQVGGRDGPRLEGVDAWETGGAAGGEVSLCSTPPRVWLALYSLAQRDRRGARDLSSCRATAHSVSKYHLKCIFFCVCLVWEVRMRG